MGEKTKVLCKWDKKHYRKKLETLRQATDAPRFACADCGRVANEKKWLCDPLPLEPRS